MTSLGMDKTDCPKASTAIEMWIESFEFFSGLYCLYDYRIPFLTFPRVKSWNEQFPPHPEPIYVDTHLIQEFYICGFSTGWR